MPAAARVGDPVVHTQALPQAEHGWLMGALKGALVGVALVGIAAVGVALTVGTAGFGTPFVVGAALIVGGAVLKYGATGFNEGAQAGAQQTVSAGQILTGSSNVYINSRKAAAACMSLANCSQHGPGKLVATGSPKVYINRKAASRTGDLGNCSFQIGPGSPNVVIGGGTGACAAISGEIPAWLQKTINISSDVGEAMIIIGGIVMGGGALATESKVAGEVAGEVETAEVTAEEEAETQALKFGNEAKIRAQMAKRGWTDAQIREAMQTKGIPATGKLGPATRYINPTTGRSVVVDNTTGEIFHVGGDGFGY